MTATTMSRKKLILGFVSLPLLALGMVLLPQHAASTAHQEAAQDGPKDPVPAYHSEVPSGPMPAMACTLAAMSLTSADLTSALRPARISPCTKRCGV